MGEVLTYAGPCPECKGKKTIENPGYRALLNSLTPEQLEVGVKVDVPETIVCRKCKGVGTHLSSGFWAMREFNRLADEGKAAIAAEEAAKVKVSA